MPVSLNRGRALSVLNLTALIDVLFLLLIYFLVASKVSEDDLKLEIPLPSAANAMPMTAEPVELVVNIDDRGSIIVDQTPVNLVGLERMIVQFVVDHPISPAVIIRAHRQVPLQIPVSAMDICVKCGAAYSLSIDEESQP